MQFSVILRHGLVGNANADRVKIKDEAEREHYTVVHRLYRGIIQLYLNAQDTTDLLLA